VWAHVCVNCGESFVGSGVTSKQRRDEVANNILGVSVVVAPAFAVYTLGYQAFEWLHLGEWRPLPLLYAVHYLGIDVTRIYAPHDWIGVAKIMQWVLSTPMSIAVPVLIVGGGALVSSIVRGD
jgi:hypothetical protein